MKPSSISKKKKGKRQSTFGFGRKAMAVTPGAAKPRLASPSPPPAAPAEQLPEVAQSQPEPAPPPATLEQLREAHMATVQRSLQSAVPHVMSRLESHGYAIVDEFLPLATVRQMRSEAESLRLNGRLAQAQYEHFDAIVDEPNVAQIELNGGDLYFECPRLHEYVVSVGSAMPAVANQKFSNARISTTHFYNRLQVSLANGASLGKHIDNTMTNLRKITFLTYLNEEWEPSHGGYLRMYANGTGPDINDATSSVLAGVDEDGHTFLDIAPLAGRVIAFWSDAMVHSVQPSFLPSEDSHRWVLTVWMATEDQAFLHFDPVTAHRHWPDLYPAPNKNGDTHA